MMRTYTVRLKVTKRQCVVLSALLVDLCELYNAALQERRDAWKICQKRISYYDQQSELTQLRAIDPQSASFPAAIQRDPLRRVQRAFDGYFRRVKAKQTPGFPRFRSVDRYDSFAADSANFSVKGDSISIVKMGTFRFKTRCRLRGTPRELIVKRRGNRWVATIACDLGYAPELKPVRSAVGIDLGVSSLVVLSDGTEIDNPKWTRLEQERLARANRDFSRKKRGSRNRIKSRERLRRTHQRIQGLRKSYLHTVSEWLVSSFDLIAHEKLNIRNMVRSNLAKSILDSAWGELLWQLRYKAESAGVHLVAVDSRNTTQLCSGCGTKVPKTLAQRQHECQECGLSLSRDHNAAINVLRRGERRVEGVQNV
jgi:putative transposase